MASALIVYASLTGNTEEGAEVLEEALEEFSGTLIFISHDRFFINKFANRTIEFENGHIHSYLGGYDDYKEEKSIRIV